MDTKNSATSGTVHFDRGLSALEQAYYSIEQRSSEDWLLYLKEFSAKLKFFDIQGNEYGNWAQLLPDQAQLKSLADWIYRDATVPEEIKALASRPDLSLLLTFIQLLKYPVEQFQALTARHLLHYYQNVLELEANKGQPDKANLIVALNEETEVLTLNRGTRFSAGVDDNDELIEYVLADPVQLNRAQVSDVHTLVKHTKSDKTTFYAAQVQSTAQQLDFPEEGVPCFGGRAPIAADLGLMISSNLLWLSSGTRQVRITFAGVASASSALLNALDIAVSTEQGKKLLPKISDNVSNLSDLNQGVRIEVQQGVEGLSLLLTFLPEYPAIGLSPDDIENGKQKPYICLSSKYQNDNFSFDKLALSVSAQGVAPTSLGNDQGELEADNPDLIFGPDPVRGASFYFTHPELNIKPLESLKLNFDWAGKPQNMHAYYHAYRMFLQANPIYQIAGVDLNNYPKHIVSLDSDQAHLGSELSLFDELEVNISAQTRAAISALKDTSQGYLDLPLTEVDPKAYPTWFKLTLTEDDFATRLYGPALQYFASQTLSSQVGANTVAEPSIMVPEPYTPQVLGMRLNYQSEQVSFDAAANHVELGHIHPLGVEPISAPTNGEAISLQPQLNNNGELIIGLLNPRLPGEVSLLFQLEPLSHSVSGLSPTITWYYRYQNTWHEIKRNHVERQGHKALVLSDSTNGLLNSGIVRLKLPEQVSLDDALLQSGRAWLKAAISYKGNSLPRLTHLKHLAAQAIEVTYVSKTESDPRLGEVLAAGTINELVELDARVDSVVQPAESFAGRSAQSETDYVMHCSEQLRHKGRALTQWDYEHLVLEAFNELYFVKCFRGTPGQTQNSANGAVTLVAIPKTRDLDHFQPLLADHQKKQIAHFLASKMPRYATLNVVDPDYREIRFVVTAVIAEGYDKGQALERINATLIEHMSPWIEKAGKAPKPINNNISLSSVVKIIAQLDEIKSIHNIATEIENDKGEFVPTQDITTRTRNEHEILVPATQHILRVYGEQEPVITGIGVMAIEFDFVVAENDKVEPPTTN